jgi:TRAP-type C4-dicarboxylate transport system permease small subunit
MEIIMLVLMFAIGIVGTLWFSIDLVINWPDFWPSERIQIAIVALISLIMFVGSLLLMAESGRQYVKEQQQKCQQINATAVLIGNTYVCISEDGRIVPTQ